MPDDILTFPEPDGARLKPGTTYELGTWTGTMPGAKLAGAYLYKVRLRDLDFRGADLEDAELKEVSFERLDLRGANLRRVRLLDTVIGLDRARFNDDTILDGVNLDALSKSDAAARLRLKRIRYAGNLKRTCPAVYWPWQIVCACGRSWLLFLVWTLVLVAVFAALYTWGTLARDTAWLPHLVARGGNNTPLGAWHGILFSLLTFLGASAPWLEWTDLCTGFWVAAETLAGLAFLGVFISIVAVHVAPHE